MHLNKFSYQKLLLLIGCILISCNNSKEDFEIITGDDNVDIPDSSNSIKILALGDSYTIGEGVCENCKFPYQLRDSLKEKKENENISVKVIARTGWTTTSLIGAIGAENLDSNYNLVTLLIGVNNQYQNKDFSIYELEFPQLVNTAISKVNFERSKLIVLSIPDYAFTPFGGGDVTISNEIDNYNNFAKNYCMQNSITFLDITDITRQGLDNPELVATDGLHPSELAYSKFVERLIPLALEKLVN